MVLAVGAAGAVAVYGLLSPPTDDGAARETQAKVSDLTRRLAALEIGVADGRASGGAADAAALRDLQTGFRDLEAEFASLNGSLRRLRSRTADLAATAGGADGLAQSLERIESRLTTSLSGVDAGLLAMDARLRAAEDRLSTLRALDARVAALSDAARAAPEAAARDAAFLLAVAHLRFALRFSGTYAAELDALRGLAGDDGEVLALLQPLEAHAAGGLPSLRELRRDFPEVAREVVVASAGGEDEGLVAAVLRRLAGLVTVRPLGEVTGNAPAAVVARAEVRLMAEDDLAAAIAELERLQDKPEGLTAWLARARARVAAEKVLADLGARALARVAAPGG